MCCSRVARATYSFVVGVPRWLKKKEGYLRFLNSCIPSVVVTYWNPSSISLVASLMFLAVLHVARCHLTDVSIHRKREKEAEVMSSRIIRYYFFAGFFFFPLVFLGTIIASIFNCADFLFKLMKPKYEFMKGWKRLAFLNGGQVRVSSGTCKWADRRRARCEASAS